MNLQGLSSSFPRGAPRPSFQLAHCASFCVFIFNVTHRFVLHLPVLAAIGVSEIYCEGPGSVHTFGSWRWRTERVVSL